MTREEFMEEVDRWENGCPACGCQSVYAGRGERGDVSITCMGCSYQVRWNAA